MKKFSKILVLLLTLVLIVTAFTVTALATDGETEANMGHGTYSKGMSTIYAGQNYGDGRTSSSWENDAAPVGSYVTNGHVCDRRGYIYVGLGEDGQNKYLVFSANPAKSSKSDNFMWDPALSGFPTHKVDGVKTYTYNVKDYPYTVVDVDVCSPTGSFGTADLFYWSFRTALKGNTNGNYTLQFNFKDFGAYLDPTPYNWQHVTLVARFVYELDDTTGLMTSAKYEVDVYVNGKYKTSMTKDYSKNTWFKDQDPQYVGFYSMRLSTLTSGVGNSALEDYNWKNYKATDVTTWPGYQVIDEEAGTYTYTDPALWSKDQAAIDQMTIHHYQSGWTSAEIAASLYDAETYQYPFGRATAQVGETMYDNMDDAIAAAAASGDTVKLLRDIEDIVTVNDFIRIDTNKYDADGVATGEYYTFNFTSEVVMKQETDTAGIFDLVDAAAFTVSVYWDYCEDCDCDDQANHGADCTCTCDATVPGHIMYAEGSAIIGTAIAYNGEIPTFEIDTVSGTKIYFAGWSKTPGGAIATADELVVTEEDLEEGMIFLYPVYEVIEYAFLTVDNNGDPIYYTVDDLDTMIAYTPANSTIKLIRDAVVSATFTTNKAFVLDLNGFDYIKFTDGTAATTAFKFPAGTTSSTPFVIMSSNGESNLYNAGLVGTKVSHSAWFLHVAADPLIDVQIGGTVNGVESATLNFYGGQLFYDENGNNKQDYEFNVTNTNFYSFDGSIFMDNRTNINLTFTNCTIYTGTGTLTRHFSKSTNDVVNGVAGKMTFINCDVITAGIGAGDNINVTKDNVPIIFDNCRISFTEISGHYRNAASGGTSYGYIKLINGTKIRITSTNADVNARTMSLIMTNDGYSLKTISESIGYNAVTTSPFVLGDDGKPTFEAVHGTKELTYAYSVISDSTVAMIGDVKYSDINAALAAATENDVIVLCKDIADTVSITNPLLTIDTNIYSGGAVSGSYYTFNCNPPSRYTSNVTDGIVTFTLDTALPVTVIWAPATPMSATTEVYLDSIPEYPNATRFVYDGMIYTVIGWSYTEGGEAEELTAITEADILSGTVTLYPIYETVLGTFEVTYPTGEVTYYSVEELSTMIADTPANSTIKLLRDAVVSDTFVTSKAFVLDLNGFDYIKFTDGTAATDVPAFKFPAKTASATPFVIMSSNGESNLYNAGLVGTKVTYGDWFLHVAPNPLIDVQIGGTVNGVESATLNFYGGQLFYDENGNNKQDYEFNVTNTNFYSFDGSIFIDNRTNINLTFTNCTIYTAGALTRHFSKSTSDVVNGIAGKMTFINCDVITAGIGAGDNINVTKDNVPIIFDNCRISFTEINGHYRKAEEGGTSYGYIKLINGTKIRITTTNADAKARTMSLIMTDDGYSLKTISESIGYNAVTTSPFVLGDDGKPTFEAVHGTKELTYTYAVAEIPTVAMINGTKYYDINDALAALTEGDTIVLYADVANTITVTFPFTIDTNKYDSEGNATGEYYTVTYTMPAYYKDTAADGKITFGINPNYTINVYWDACPTCSCGNMANHSDNCACNCGYVISGHPFYAVTKAAFGETPEYPKMLITADGKLITLIGWATTPGGDAVEITAITEEQIISGAAIYFYPIYEEYTQYDIGVTADDGTVTYYSISEYATAFANAKDGSTVVLYNDLVITSNLKFTASITIDLNGHKLQRHTTAVKKYNATGNADSGYVKGDLIETVSTGSKGYVFLFGSKSYGADYVSYENKTLTIKSSRPGAIISSTHVTADQLIIDGVVVDTQNVSTSYGGFISCYPGKSTFNILGENITVYASNIIYAEHGGNVGMKLNIDGGTYVTPNPASDKQPMIYISRGGTHTFKNATFYSNGYMFVRDGGEYLKSGSFIFENCDIINAKLYLYDPTTTYYFNNCRLDATFSTSHKGKIILGEGTVTSNKLRLDGTASGTSYLPNTSEKVYTDFPIEFVIDGTTLNPTEQFTTKTVTISYVYEVFNNEEDCVHIIWLDPNGNYLNESYALKNSTAIIPTVKIPVGDGFRAITNIKTWEDQYGNVSDLTVGESEEYYFWAVIPSADEIEYCSYVTSAMFNMVYFSDFAYNVYIPKVAGVNITNLGTHAPIDTVMINQVEYWVYTAIVAPSQGLEDYEVVLEYIIDGQAFTARFRPSAIFYANTIAADSTSSDLELAAVGSLVRYIEETYNALGKNDAIAQEKLDGFYAMYTPEDYVTEYPDANIFDSTRVAGLLEYITLEIDGGRVRFVFKLTDTAVSSGYKLLVNGSENTLTVVTNDSGTFYKTKNAPLRTLISSKLTLSVVDADGNPVYVGGNIATTSYSLAAYINANSNVAITKALYAFGTALLEYHPLLQDKYTVDKLTLFGEDIKNYSIAADESDSAEYLTAVNLQLLLYNKTGYWLEIVPSDKADKSIVISVVENTGGIGFYATFSEGRMEFVCEYANSIQNEVLSFFVNKIDNAEAKTVNFTDADNYEKNVRDVYYSDFGAVGDGVTDDSGAIRAAHVYANNGGHTVYADPGAKYYIGPMAETISIKTNVFWGDAEFIIDDSVIGPNDLIPGKETTYRSVNIFTVSRQHSMVSLTPSNNAYIAALNKQDLAIDASECLYLNLDLGYTAMLRVVNENHKSYIRYGANANSGADQYELVYVDAEGNIDPESRFLFDYDKITGIEVYRVDDSPLTIDGGTFTTIANQAPRKYTAYARGIKINRPNTTISNLKHYIVGETDTGAPYGAFINPYFVCNLNVVDCVFTGHRQYKETETPGKETTGMGSYDISSSNSIDVTFTNCIQSNFFENTNGSGSAVTSGLWGIMGSSYSKNVAYIGCTLSRFDAHAGVYNVTVKDSTIVHLTVVGGGTLTVENTHYYNNIMVQFRTDYGNFWHGTASFKNITMHTNSNVNIVYGTWYNHYFGYPTALPTHVTVDGLTLTNPSVNVNLFSNDIMNKAHNDLAAKEIDGVVNKNPMPAPITYTIKNSPTTYKYVIPDKTVYKYFANTVFNVNGTIS